MLWGAPTVTLDHLDLLDDAAIRTRVAASEGWRTLGLLSLARARQLSPVSHEAMLAGVHGPPKPGGGLKASLEVRFVYGVDPRIEIGSKRTVGEDNLALLALIELGTEAHPISPREDGPGVLVFITHGVKVITSKTVKHPGTKKNPFVERAMQQIIHTSMGATLVAI